MTHLAAPGIDLEAQGIDLEAPGMQKLNIDLQTAHDNHIFNTLKELSTEEQAIAKRMLVINTLLTKLNALKNEESGNGNISLSDFSDLIEEFQKLHFPAICAENKSVVTDNQNPFPEGFEIDNVDSTMLAHCIDKLFTLAEQEQNALTHLSRDLESSARIHNLISLMTAQFAKDSQGLAEAAVKNQNR